MQVKNKDQFSVEVYSLSFAISVWNKYSPREFL